MSDKAHNNNIRFEAYWMKLIFIDQPVHVYVYVVLLCVRAALYQVDIFREFLRMQITQAIFVLYIYIYKRDAGDTGKFELLF